MIQGHWILVDKQPVKATLMEWGRWCELDPNESGRRIEATVIGDARVSTVFLGIDHNWRDSGPPILFETMIFGGEHDEYQDRCCTYDEAKVMHTKAIWLVRGADEVANGD